MNTHGEINEKREWHRQVASGDEEAWRIVVAEHHALVYAVAFQLLHDEHEARDLTQEVFVQAYLTVKDFRGDSKFSTWLYRIAYNLGLNYRRDLKRERIELVAAPESLPEEMVMTEEAKPEEFRSLEAKLKELPAHDRMMLTLFYLDELSTKEIAETMELSLSAVKVRMHRARRKLQQLTGPHASGRVT